MGNTFYKDAFSGRATGFEVFIERKRRIQHKIPSSIIRLGDGEGAILGYQNITWLSFQKVCESDMIARKPAL